MKRWVALLLLIFLILLDSSVGYASMGHTAWANRLSSLYGMGFNTVFPFIKIPIELTPPEPGEPSIWVDPSDFAITHDPAPQVITQTMTIYNEGSGPGSRLFWTIDICPESVPLPWLTYVPANGSTIQQGSTPITLTFDSTGVASGNYNGTLCIASNDPFVPTYVVTVALNVVVPPTPTSEPPTPTSEPPTATPEPPTATPEPPTTTPEPPTVTPEPPSATPELPTPTSAPPTATSGIPTATATPSVPGSTPTVTATSDPISTVTNTPPPGSTPTATPNPQLSSRLYLPLVRRR